MAHDPDVAAPRFESLQDWEGRVVDVSDTTFWAVVVDSKDGFEEEVEFDLDKVRPDDIDLFGLGAIFDWSIGYRTEDSGERSLCSVLVFRRLPVWTSRDIELATQRARDLRDYFGW